MLTLKNISFQNPWVLFFLLLLLILPIIHFRWVYKKEPSINFPSLKGIDQIRNSLNSIWVNLPFILKLLALGFFIVALARPVSYLEGEDVFNEGIDICLILDISGSMLARDFQPDRLEAAKEVVSSFIDKRTSDRIGLVIFSREAFTQCPLTVDYNILKDFLSKIKSGILPDGTAIGNAIANGVNRLKDTKSKSKIMILLTDGDNNAGEVDPNTAAEIAKLYKIKIYTIGVGSMGMADVPVQTPYGIQYQRMKVDINEDLLRNISNETGGKYFRATDNDKLEKIYDDINQLEKTKSQVTSYRNAKQLFYEWVSLGLGSLILSFIFSAFIIRRIP